MEKTSIYPMVHYDKVIMAWPYIFGRQFHLGCFLTPGMLLEEAALAMNDALLDLGPGKPDHDSVVLDVGCGIGAPAFYLNEKFGCSVVGISTSRKGVDLANEWSRKKRLTDRVRFLVADGTDNRLPGSYCDIVWLMESSHTMKDKHKLLTECFRTLKPGGQLFLGDVMPRSRYKVAHYFKCLCRRDARWIIGRMKMKKVFGPAWTEPLHRYAAMLGDIGYQHVVAKDVGEDVQPTFECWRRNAAMHEREILRYFSSEELNDFLAATGVMQDWYQNGILGYGLVSAIKPG